jgi:ankyrin repeat protein
MVNHSWDLNDHYTEHCGDRLAIAIIGGEYDFAKWLLKHGHDSTPRGGIHGPEPITETVCGETDSIEMLKLLLAYGISLEESGVGTAAADGGNLEALRLLLDHGIDLEDRCMIGYPFDDDRDEPEESCDTALYRACRQGHFECVELLLGRGADLKTKDDRGTSCVNIAKKRGHQEVVELLEKRGVTE